jgi:hypothetical protein
MLMKRTEMDLLQIETCCYVFKRMGNICMAHIESTFVFL